jgi:hypothetical protein
MSIGTYLSDYMIMISTTLGIPDLASNIPQTVIDETVEAYGVLTEAECTDIYKLHAIARLKVWELCLRIPGLSKGVYELIRENILRCEKEVNSYSSIQVFYKRPTENPYQSDFS